MKVILLVKVILTIMTEIPKFATWPIWGEDDRKALLDVIDSGQWWCGAPKAVQGENVW